MSIIRENICCLKNKNTLTLRRLKKVTHKTSLKLYLDDQRNMKKKMSLHYHGWSKKNCMKNINLLIFNCYFFMVLDSYSIDWFGSV
jgi:hypothetical protein